MTERDPRDFDYMTLLSNFVPHGLVIAIILVFFAMFGAFVYFAGASP